MNEPVHQSAPGSLSEHIEQNIEALVALQRRETEDVSPWQRRLELIGRLVARPLYFVSILVFVLLWTVVNLCAPRFGVRQFDPPPFQALQGIVSFLALITTTVVLAAQNRQSNLERQRMHLDLQINLLSEQKVSKCIHLLEELRRDMPFVPDRYDEQAALLQHRADADEVITALKKGGLTHEPNQASSGETKP